MLRRTMLAGGVGLAGVLAAGASHAQSGWRRYILTTEVDLSHPDAPAELWVPVFETLGDYQRAAAPVLSGDGRMELVRDAKYRAPMAHASWATPGGGRRLTVVQASRRATAVRTGRC